eukprot:COSAG04_NODE_111_length_25781_cov_90.291761_16_plen_481_part_00
MSEAVHVPRPQVREVRPRRRSLGETRPRPASHDHESRHCADWVWCELRVSGGADSPLEHTGRGGGGGGRQARSCCSSVGGAAPWTARGGTAHLALSHTPSPPHPPSSQTRSLSPGAMAALLCAVLLSAAGAAAPARRRACGSMSRPRNGSWCSRAGDSGALWAVAAASMLVAVRPKPPFQAREKPSGRAHDSHSALGPQTDVRVLSPLQKEVLLNKEILAVHQDPSPVPGGVVSRPLAPLHSEVWLRRLASGDAAVALFNGGSKNASLTLRFAALGLGLGAQSRCSLRDLWAHEEVGQHVGEYTRVVPAHGTAVLRLRCSPPPPAPLPAPAPQQPRPAPSPPPVLDAAASELIDISRRSRVFDGIGALSGGAPQNTRPSLRCVFTPIALCCRWWDVAAAVRLPGAAAQPDPRRPVPARKGRGGADPEGRDGWRTLPRNCCRLLCFLPSSSDIVADRTPRARRRRRRKIGILSRFATLPSR